MYGEIDVNLIRQKYERIKMLEDLLFQVVERTLNFTEGFYSLYRLNELQYVGSMAFTTVQEFYEHLDNVAATIQHEIDRIEVK